MTSGADSVPSGRWLPRRQRVRRDVVRPAVISHRVARGRTHYIGAVQASRARRLLLSQRHSGDTTRSAETVNSGGVPDVARRHSAEEANARRVDAMRTRMYGCLDPRSGAKIHGGTGCGADTATANCYWLRDNRDKPERHGCEYSAGRLKLSTPLAITAQSDSITINGTAAGSTVQFINTAPLPGDSVTRAGHYARWSFDGSISETKPSSKVSLSLHVGDTTDMRNAVVLLPTGVTKLRITVQGTAQYVFTVPIVPPPTPASVIQEGSDTAHLVPGGRSPFSRDKLLLRFAKGATIIDKQAAIDAVDGTVVGGGLGEYYVRISVPTSDKSGKTVVHAINILRKQHGVKAANIDVPGGPSPAYLRPTDSTTG
jgi:hypothetical protein